MAKLSPKTTGISALEIGEAASGLVHDMANLTQAIMLRAEYVAVTDRARAYLPGNCRLDRMRLVEETEIQNPFKRHPIDLRKKLARKDPAFFGVFV